MFVFIFKKVSENVCNENVHLTISIDTVLCAYVEHAGTPQNALKFCCRFGEPVPVHDAWALSNESFLGGSALTLGKDYLKPDDLRYV
ncbi:MAG: hypothetical protein Roseis2KO_51140 [Roseivirga sp.]